MERVTFIVERTGAHIECLLNPESLVRRRVSGLRPRRGTTGHLTGAALTDDQMLWTGGGRTELDLDLLFDLSLVVTPPDAEPVDDVQDLTQPLWQLTENGPGSSAYGQPPLVRFLWGKSLNVLGVVVSVAERLEDFTEAGAPRRSWLRLRLARVSEQGPGEASAIPTLDDADRLPVSDDEGATYEVRGSEPADAADEPSEPSRPDLLAGSFYGDPGSWRPIMEANGIDDPTAIPAGTVLVIPPRRALT